MLEALDTLAAWRRAVIPGLSVSHALSDNAASVPLPSSFLSAAAPGRYVVPVCVELEVTETVSAEATGEADHPALSSVVDSLRALSGQARLVAGSTARIHRHVLVSESPAKDENQRRQSVLVWKVVASWG